MCILPPSPARHSPAPCSPLTSPPLLSPPRLDNLLDPADVLELYRKHTSDPVQFSAAALARFYDVEEELVQYLLQYARTPVVVSVDGDLYGVYDVRDVEELLEGQPAAAPPLRE